MKKVSILCDRCGTEIVGSPIKMIPEAVDRDSGEWSVSVQKDEDMEVCFSEMESKDFCMDCTREIIRYALGGMKENSEITKAVQEMTADSPPENGTECEEHDNGESDTDTDNEPKPARNRIDVGKVMALRKAGWSVKQIAEEFSVTDQAVYRVINKLREEGKL